MSRARRRPELEAVRGVVVSAVVGYHALRLVLEHHGQSWDEISPLWWWAGTGRLGVDAFFVLAGYLVVSSWGDCRSRAASVGSAITDFARRRGWRILPPYLVMLALIVPVAAPELLLDQRWGDLARLLTLQQYLDVHLPPQVNVPIWSLTTEVHFYVVAPLVAWLLRRVGGWPLVLPALALALWWAQTDARGDLAAGLLPGRIDQFVVGAAAGAVIAGWKNGHRRRTVDLLTHRSALPLLLIALVGIGTYHGATWRGGDDGLLPLTVHPVAGLVLAGLLVRLECGPTPKMLTLPALHWLGGISFSLYLWHYPILQHGLRQVHPSQPVGLVALLALLLVLAGVAVAAFFRELVERPAAQRARGRRPETVPRDGVREPQPSLAPHPV